MGDVVRLPGVQIERSSSSDLRPEQISARRLREIDRDIRYLQTVTARARDTAKLAELIAKAADIPDAASRIALYVTIGKER